MQVKNNNNYNQLVQHLLFSTLSDDFIFFFFNLDEFVSIHLKMNHILSNTKQEQVLTSYFLLTIK